MKSVGPTTTGTDTSVVWVLSVERQTLSSARSTALAKSTFVHGALPKVATTWAPRMCS